MLFTTDHLPLWQLIRESLSGRHQRQHHEVPGEALGSTELVISAVKEVQHPKNPIALVEPEREEEGG